MTANSFMGSHLIFLGGATTSTIVPVASGCSLQVLAAFVKTTASVGYPLSSLTQIENLPFKT
ncbi:hypothetical protein IQ05_02975 [Flavobacterium tiangeerense]|uniref:Uncharacterized protein n=1 Tax=Flavobacterium tiangeerense TaxID=459471 RepID=A0ABY3FJW4_9FLAO|nr:hypothetical protein IQ05_02975 [Flavobacterium tiangeerense]